MDVGKIIVGEPPKPAKASRIDPRPAWRALAMFALLFVAVGLVDVSLALYGADLTLPVPRFAAFAGASGGLPLLTIGALGCVMAAIASASTRLIWIGSVVSGLLFAAVAVSAIQLMSVTSSAFAAAPPAGHFAMNQALLRGWVFYGAFGLALAVGAIIGVSTARGAAET